MEMIWIMLPLSILLGTVFLALFILTLKSGQYDDLDTPAYRVLLEDDKELEDESK